MIVRAGTAVTIPLLFLNGQPDGDVMYKVYDPAGLVLATGQIVVPADAVSVLLQVDADKNTLAQGAVLSYRDLAWTYAIDGVIQNGETRYTIEARLPFGVSADGVRAKLGVNQTDLPDGDISLAKAYLSFRTAAGAALLDAITDNVAITDAIEAQAALSLIPTMAVRVATKESSGTNQFQRQAIDWGAVAAYLEGFISAGYLAVDPNYDATADYGPLLIVVTPATDAITGATV